MSRKRIFVLALRSAKLHLLQGVAERKRKTTLGTRPRSFLLADEGKSQSKFQIRRD